MGGLLLVAGFVRPLHNLPELDAFTEAPLSWETLQHNVSNKHVLLSEDDTVVSPLETEYLSQVLGAPLQKLQQRGHFTAKDGCLTLPEAAIWLQQTLHLSVCA